jgi:hypothetical protein
MKKEKEDEQEEEQEKQEDKNKKTRTRTNKNKNKNKNKHKNKNKTHRPTREHQIACHIHNVRLEAGAQNDKSSHHDGLYRVSAEQKIHRQRPHRGPVRGD